MVSPGQSSPARQFQWLVSTGLNGVTIKRNRKVRVWPAVMLLAPV